MVLNKALTVQNTFGTTECTKKFIRAVQAVCVALKNWRLFFEVDDPTSEEIKSLRRSAFEKHIHMNIVSQLNLRGINDFD